MIRKYASKPVFKTSETGLVDHVSSFRDIQSPNSKATIEDNTTVESQENLRKT